MRVVFERQAFSFATYECHLCGAQNKFVSIGNSSEWLTDGSLDCHACKARFQISLDRKQKKQGGNGPNDRIDTETRHCIRNFRVTQTEPEIRSIPFPIPIRSIPFPSIPEESARMASTSCHDPSDGFAMPPSQFDPSHGALLKSGPIAQQLATSSQPCWDDMIGEDDRFEECEDGLEEGESI